MSHLKTSIPFVDCLFMDDPRSLSLSLSFSLRYFWITLGPSAIGTQNLAHQNRTIAMASDFRVDGAKSPEISQKERVLGPEIAARNHRTQANFHRTLKLQCSIAFSCLRNRCDFWGPRWASQSQIARIAAISVR